MESSNKEAHKSDSSGFGYGQLGGCWYHFLVKFQILESLSRGKDLEQVIQEYVYSALNILAKVGVGVEDEISNKLGSLLLSFSKLREKSTGFISIIKNDAC